MTQITIDPETANKLRESVVEVDLCTPDGEVLGRFQPTTLQPTPHQLCPPVGDDEIRRRFREDSGRPLSQLLDELEGR